MIFKTLKKEEKKFDNALEGTEDYETYLLNDLDPDTTFTGKPLLSQIWENEFEDFNTGKMVKKYSANLTIINHDNEEIVKARLNLKSTDDMVTFWQRSLGYDIIDSIEELHGEKAGVENVYTISFKELQEYINNLKTMSITVIHHNEKFEYNTFRINKTEA